MSRHKPQDWQSVDWTKTTQQLVSEMQVSKTAVIYWRKRMSSTATRLPARAWRKVCWEKSTSIIAREMGVTISAASQQRAKLAPETIRSAASAPTATHPVRCTDKGWDWLQSQALGKGHTSVGKWADSAGRKAPKRKGNDQVQELSGGK